MRFKKLDVVVLQKELPRLPLKHGDVGTVVEIYEPDGLEVEFLSASGETDALVTLKENDVRPVAREDRLAVRSHGVA